MILILNGKLSEKSIAGGPDASPEVSLLTPFCITCGSASGRNGTSCVIPLRHYYKYAVCACPRSEGVQVEVLFSIYS